MPPQPVKVEGLCWRLEKDKWFIWCLLMDFYLMASKKSNESSKQTPVEKQSSTLHNNWHVRTARMFFIKVSFLFIIMSTLSKGRYKYILTVLSQITNVTILLWTGENILILHPVFCGSHESVLRTLGNHLVQQGHQVTQVLFKHKKSPEELNTNVSIITLTINDHLNNCGRYVNDEGVLDTGIAWGKYYWNQGHSIFSLPLDLFCLIDVHCYTLHHDP